MVTRSFTVTPRRVGLVLASGVAGLLAAHVLITIGSEVTGHPLYFLPPFFNLGKEANLPTYASALNLLLASALLTLVALTTPQAGRVQRLGWWGLAAGFALMSVDEAALIHEGIVGKLILRKLGRGDGVAYYRWYLAYVPLVLALGAVYVPFLLSLPRRLAALFVVAGALFVGGAIGVEMVESALSSEGASRVRVLVNIAFEEGAEMAGVALFNYALVSHLATARTRLAVAFQDAPVPEPSLGDP